MKCGSISLFLVLVQILKETLKAAEATTPPARDITRQAKT